MHKISGDEASREAARRPWLVLAVVAGGLFVAVVSTTVVSVALPTIGRDLHAGATDLQWIVDAYVLIYASLLVAGGVIGDRRGRKGVFVLGAVIFGLGSLVTGLAPSVAVMLVGRVLQGVGPALLVPGSLTIIRAAFDDERRRAMAIGLWSMSSGLAMAVGPALGGGIIDVAGWRWVFLFNVPLAAVLAVLAARFIPRLPRGRAAGRFDWFGAVMTVAGIALLVYAVIEGQTGGWTSPAVVAAFALGAAALAGFAVWERRRAEPLVDVSLFTRPGFTAANVAALVVFFAFVGAIVYLSAYFQQVQGHSPIAAGLDVSVIGIALALASAAAGWSIGRFGDRWPMITGLLISAGATFGLLRLGPGTGMGAIWWIFALLGMGVGLCGTATTTTAMSAVGTADAGMASATLNAMRQVGQVFGVAVLGALVYARLPAAASAGRLDRAHGSLFVSGLHNALWVSGAALLAAALLAILIIPRGQEA